MPRCSLPFRAFFPLPSPHLFVPARHASPDEDNMRNIPVVHTRSWKKNLMADLNKKKIAKFQFQVLKITLFWVFWGTFSSSNACIRVSFQQKGESKRWELLMDRAHCLIMSSFLVLKSIDWVLLLLSSPSLLWSLLLLLLLFEKCRSSVCKCLLALMWKKNN